MPEATVVIKGRNELTYAVNQAEQQLKRLTKQGELLGKVLRGGAIAGAIVAFERLAENAEAAAKAIGDEGTAAALGQLNKQIDTLKAKGLNVVGKVLGNVYSAFSGDKKLQLAEQIDFLKRMQGRSFVAVGYKDIGTGYFTAAEGAAKLLQLEKQLADIHKYESTFQDRRLAALSRPGGSGILTRYSSAFENEPGGGGAGKAGPQFSAQFLAYVKNLERMGEANRHFQETLKDADRVIEDGFNKSLEEAEINLDKVTTSTIELGKDMTVFADQAARNMQSAFADFLFDPFEDGLRGMAAGFADTIRRMIAEMAAAEALHAFFSWAGSNTSGAISRWFGSMASSVGARAMGGPVAAGKPYIVGERGPELFVANTSGRIIPNGGGGGGVTMNYTIDARGADAERIMAVMPKMLERTKQETIAAVYDLQRRGRFA